MEVSRIIGPPGCGKTTYLSRQVRRAWEAGHEVMVCSLTKAAAEEVAGRDLPIARERVGTLHSHAYRSLAGGFTGIADLAKYIDEWNQEYPRLALSGGNNDLDEDNANPYAGKAPGDKAYEAMNLFRARIGGISEYALIRDVTPAKLREFSKLWSDWKQANNLIDFTDMLELALQNQDSAPGSPDVIFADEAQDFSALEWALLHKWGEAAGRLVIVGDPYQNLYEWRGSDSNLFFEGDDETLRVLQQSYRVPAIVHNAAMTFIESMPGYRPIDYYPKILCPDCGFQGVALNQPCGQCGVVVTEWVPVEGLYEPLAASWKSFEPAIRILEESLSAGKEVMILTSCAYMLAPVIKILRDQGIPFHNPYRKKNGAWNPLARRGNTISASDRLLAFLRMGEEGFWTKEDLRCWLSGMKCSEILPSKMSFKKFEEGPLASIQEVEGEIPYGVAELLCGAGACEASYARDYIWFNSHLTSSRRSASDFPVAISKKSGTQVLREEPKVTIGTIHSVKGAESDVVILAPDLSQRGVETWHNGDAGKASIYRLFYVGMTRTKEGLHVLQPTSPNAVRLP